MVDILECVAAILWLVLGIWTGVKFHRLNRRMDIILADIERKMEDDQ